MFDVYEHTATCDRLIATYDNEHDAQVAVDYYNRGSNYAWYYFAEKGKEGGRVSS